MNRRARSTAAWALGLAFALGFAAAHGQQVTLAPSAAIACMTPAAAERGQPKYPLMAYKSARAGRVVATVTFDTIDWLTGPGIRIDLQEGGDEFADAVRQHLSTPRVPCLPPRGKAAIQFDFVFNPNSEKVFWQPPVDVDDAARRAMLDCVVGTRLGAKPDFPTSALSSGQHGRIYALMRYAAPDQPPEVHLHHRPGAESLAAAARDWLLDRRMPCHQGMPVVAAASFKTAGLAGRHHAGPAA